MNHKVENFTTILQYGITTGIFPKISTDLLLENGLNLINTPLLDQIYTHIAEARINFSSHNRIIRENSILKALAEINYLLEIGIKKIVIHPGSTKGLIDSIQGIEHFIKCLEIMIIESEGKMKFIVENMTGGNKLLKNNEEMKYFIEKCREKNIFKYIALCFDTCHFFGSNYDLNDITHIDWPFCEFIDYVEVIHLNNSLGKLGGGLDRHGYWCCCLTPKINLEVGKKFYNTFKFAKNIILETNYEPVSFIQQCMYLQNQLEICQCITK